MLNILDIPHRSLVWLDATEQKYKFKISQFKSQFQFYYWNWDFFFESKLIPVK